MYHIDDLLLRIQDNFDNNNLAAFKRFIAQYNDCNKWILTSDYNWGQPSRPHDAIAFTLYPDPISLSGQELMGELFKADFKNIKEVPEKARMWFRSGAAFHICFTLDKESSLFHSNGVDRLTIARESVQSTLNYLTEVHAPQHIVRVYQQLLQESKARGFPVTIYGDLLLLSTCYAFITGILAREDRLQHLLWMSDRDRLTTWHNNVLTDIALVQAVRYVSRFGGRVDAVNLPFFVLTPDDSAKKYDPVIRPADYMAGALSAWSSSDNTIRGAGEKYVAMLRDAIAENEYAALLHIRMGKISMSVSSYVLTLTDQRQAGIGT